MPQNRDAKTVVLKQVEQHLPAFYQRAARLRARGNTVNRGDQLMAFMVDATDPEGPVLVTDSTQFVFSSSQSL